MDAALDDLVKKVCRYAGHPVPSTANPDAAPAGGVFTRHDIEGMMNEHLYHAERYSLDYVLSANGAGQIRAYSLLGDWATDTVLATGGGTTLVPNTSDFLLGSWKFNAPQVYPAYATGRSYDLHAAAGDLLEGWAAKVKLEHDLGIGDLRLNRRQKAQALLELAKLQQQKRRILSVRVPTSGTW